MINLLISIIKRMKINLIKNESKKNIVPVLFILGNINDTIER